MGRWNKTIIRLFVISIVFLLTGLGLSIHIPYYTMQAGSAIDASSVVKVEAGSEGAGNFYFTTIAMKEGQLFDYFYAKLSDQVELVPKEKLFADHESNEEYTQKGKAHMIASQKHAIMSAFRFAHKPLKIHHQGVQVLDTIDPNNPLQSGDRILKINGQSAVSIDQLNQQLAKRKTGDRVKVHIERKGKIKELTVKLVSLPDHRVGLGVYPSNLLEVETKPKVNFRNTNIGGPSAGLMFALEIFDQLVEQDLTGGMEIAGTGTVSEFGNVGQIGGIEYKVVAAENLHAEIFFCPKDLHPQDQNEKLAKKKVKEMGSNMKVVPVQSLQEAVQYLQQKDQPL